MNWTTEVPTQPGYYWVRTSDERPFVADLYEQWGSLHWADSHRPLQKSLEWWEDAEIVVEWYGPIEPPAKEEK